MGPEGAANIIFRNEIAAAADPAATRKQKVAEYGEKFANPYVAAASGHIDAVIGPSDTRKLLVHAIQVSEQVRIAPEEEAWNPPFLSGCGPGARPVQAGSIRRPRLQE